MLQQEIPESKTARHLYMIQLNPELLTCTRREFFDALYAENVHAQVHYLPVYWHSYYEKLGYPKGLCPNAEYLYEHVMSIPLFYSMTDEDVESVITAIKKCSLITGDRMENEYEEIFGAHFRRDGKRL